MTQMCKILLILEAVQGKLRQRAQVFRGIISAKVTECKEEEKALALEIAGEIDEPPEVQELLTHLTEHRKLEIQEWETLANISAYWRNKIERRRIAAMIDEELMQMGL